MPAPATGTLPATVVVLMCTRARSTRTLAPATGTGHTLRGGVGVVPGPRGALIGFGTRGLGGFHRTARGRNIGTAGVPSFMGLSAAMRGIGAVRGSRVPRLSGRCGRAGLRSRFRCRLLRARLAGLRSRTAVRASCGAGLGRASSASAASGSGSACHRSRSGRRGAIRMRFGRSRLRAGLGCTGTSTGSSSGIPGVRGSLRLRRHIDNRG